MKHRQGHALQPVQAPEQPARAIAPHAEKAMAEAKGYRLDADAPNTKRAVLADWRAFEAWCRDAGLDALPAAPTTIGAYLASMGKTHALSTLRRHLSSISRRHKVADMPIWPGHPAIRDVLRGIGQKTPQPKRQADALTITEVRKIVAACPEDAAGLRDRALVLIGYTGALRRSELAGIDVEHIKRDATGIRITLPRSKGDQEGEGAIVDISRGSNPLTCPVRALDRWLERSGTKFGPVFRRVDRHGCIDLDRLNPASLYQLIRRRAHAAGLEGRISPHGLRAGFITQAHRNGVLDSDIMEHTRHRDLKTMRSYIRTAKRHGDSPSGKVGT